jgi:hypothetical protein
MCAKEKSGSVPKLVSIPRLIRGPSPLTDRRRAAFSCRGRRSSRFLGDDHLRCVTAGMSSSQDMGTRPAEFWGGVDCLSVRIASPHEK